MYVELHARSAFSFLEGTSLPEDLVAACTAFQMPAMALLDRDGVYGSPRFHLAAERAGIKAHIGAEVTCEKHPPQRHRDTENFCVPLCFCGGFRLPVLAASRSGYQNLCRLITKMKLRAAKGEGAVHEDELREHAAGLICLTGDDKGPLAAALAQGGVEEARRTVQQLIHIFGRENVYVEVQRHFLREEEARNHVAIQIARSLKLPLLATNGVCYTTHQQRELGDVFTALHHHRTLATAGRLLAPNSERNVKSPEEMAALFADLPEAIANTVELSNRLQFTLEDLGYEFPKYPVPEDETMMSFLRERTREGFIDRYGGANSDLRQRAKRQIERELALIERLELAGYFLIVWDLVRFCREQEILVQGRGSAANSAVCYSLGITAVDPIKMDLLFERFLSAERGEWPDIDLDLPSGDQRERVIQHVYRRYGERGAAMTANVITYRGRLSAREIGKALGLEPETLDRVAAVVGHWEFRDEHDSFDRRFHDAGLDLRHPRLRKYLELCEAVQDLPRHLGQHSGGMVICQGQLDSVVPLEPASMPGRVVVQWDKEDCADMGIIKVDLLGLGMMAVLEDSIEIIRRDYGEEVDLAHLPADDRAVYSTLQKADTIGMFQIESRAQMSCLPRLRPQRFYDIVVQVAIIRPGPIVGQMVNPFLERRQGRQKVTYAHPSLEPVLERTLGVPLFQEQLLRIAMIAANFSGGEAEELRRAMGFKRSQQRMKEIEAKLRAGMTHNGIAPAAQEEIILSITSFALYGFPESHAASFALLAYASAYLKCHYLAAFTAALLNNQPMGFYHPATIVSDAQRHGLKVLPVDVTKSDWLCALEHSAFSTQHSANLASDSKLKTSNQNNSVIPSEGVKPESRDLAFSTPMVGPQGLKPSSLPASNGTAEAVPSETLFSEINSDDQFPSHALRLGLRYVRGLREEAGQAIVFERNKSPLASIHDLIRRVPELRKDELDTLAEIGALNSIGRGNARFLDWGCKPSLGMADDFCSTIHYPLATGHSKLHRRDALWQVARAVHYSGPLLEELPEPDSPSPLQRMNHEERLVADYRGTGMTVGPHPMAYRREPMNRLGVRRASELAHLPNNRPVRVAGCVIVRQRPGTAKGFVFLSMEDETGIANIIITPDMFQQNRLLLVSEKFVMVEGILQNQDNVVSVKARRIVPLHVTKAETISHDFH
ncbi:MAG TPA: error-prone DNA polymerase [Terriglobales bacterium]|nr:error-prone DNA polymerase [Terriglobales bacterium]